MATYEGPDFVTTWEPLMSDDTNDDLELDALSDFQDVISQRAIAFCNVARLAGSLEDAVVKDLCLTMMRKLTASIKSPSTASLHVVGDQKVLSEPS
jgi:hypothetical protein